MDSLKQYIELFEQHRATIDSHSPEILNRRRDKAYSMLKKVGKLPEKGDEGYPLISINEMFAPDYGLNITRLPVGKNIPQKAVCGSGTPYSALVVNDSFMFCGGSLPAGVELCSLAEGCEKYPELFEKEIAPSDNPLVALNDLLVQDGIFIRIAKGTQLSRPIQVLSVFNSTQPMMGVRRIRIHVEADAKASVLLCDHPFAESADHLSCRVVEASIGPNSSLDIYDLEEALPQSNRASVVGTEQEKDSRLSICSMTLNGGATRNEFYPRYLSENCETRVGGLAIGGKKQIIDNAVFLTHDKSHTSSEQLFKYALFDDSKGSFEGMVKVAHGAEHCTAHQTNRNLLASAGARMYAMPQLEIYCDEVKASHGSATGQLDERALFYMRQRGIPEAEARMMLVNAFMTDVLDGIADEALRERLRHLVDVRLRGADTVCASCK